MTSHLSLSIIFRNAINFYRCPHRMDWENGVVKFNMILCQVSWYTYYTFLDKKEEFSLHLMCLIVLNVCMCISILERKYFRRKRKCLDGILLFDALKQVSSFKLVKTQFLHLDGSCSWIISSIFCLVLQRRFLFSL